METGSALTVPEPRKVAARTGRIIAPFSYAELDQTVAAEAKKIAASIRTREAKMTRTALEIGADLIRMKERLPHGKFGPWVEREVKWQIRHAENYMMVARELGGKSEKISHFNMRALTALAKADDVVRATLFAEIEKHYRRQSRLTSRDVQRLVGEASAVQAALAKLEALCDRDGPTAPIVGGHLTLLPTDDQRADPQDIDRELVELVRDYGAQMMPSLIDRLSSCHDPVCRSLLNLLKAA